MSAPAGTKRRALYVGIVVDVESVLRGHPPASNATAPMKVPFDPAQLIVTTTQGTAANAKGVIALEAREGETLRVFALSGSNNFEDAALIAALESKGGSVVEDFELVALAAATAVPVPGDEPLSETTVQEDVWFWQSRVVAGGTEPFKLVIALYGRDDRGQPHFAGLYQWNLKFRVQGDAASMTGQNEEEIS